jgi:hypothetical protein
MQMTIEPYEFANENIDIGYKRLKYYIQEVLNFSVIINSNHQLLPHLKTLKNYVVEIPMEYNDFAVGSILYTKFSNITKKYFHICVFSIDSILGDHISYTITEPSDIHHDLSGNHWWNTDLCNTNNNHVVSWEELNLNDRSGFTIIQGGKSADK